MSINLTYNESNKKINISDGIKKQHFFMKISLLFNITCAVLNLLFVLSEQQYSTMGFIWMLIGLFSFFLLFWIGLKKTSRESIGLHEVAALEVKQFFGRTNCALLLTNGRRRDLLGVQSKSEAVELKEFFSRIGLAEAL